MTNTMNLAPTTPAIEWVGPCGCPACDKWTDCDWCLSCTPEDQIQGMLDWEEQMREEEALREEEAMPFWEFLYGEE